MTTKQIRSKLAQLGAPAPQSRFVVKSPSVRQKVLVQARRLYDRGLVNYRVISTETEEGYLISRV